MEAVELHATLSNLLPLLKEKYSVERMGYFGSYSKGKQSVDSDLDILVYFNQPVGWGFFELKDFLEEHLSMQVDLVSYHALIPALKDEILETTNFID